MKGAVFIALNEFIEENHGMETWETLLDKVKPQCEGIYTSAEDYPDEEMQRYVLTIAEHTDLPTHKVAQVFGRYLFDELNTKFPVFTQLNSTLFPFLESIENVIHKEVRKLYDNTSLPTIEPNKTSDDVLEIHYSSPRRLCFLAEGLIEGAADYFNEAIDLAHPECMHNGHEQCLLVVTRKDPVE